MKIFPSFKEKRLRLYLDEYRLNTVAGEWITPLNPDNIEIEFADLGELKSMLRGKRIFFNLKYEAKDLFPQYVKELWHLKQKRERPIKFLFYKIFNPWNIYIPAKEKEAIAYKWLTEKRYNE
jgi:hypothetical protein